ncbi:MAG TPA: ribonuclease [Sphingomicrobium sp.]
MPEWLIERGIGETRFALVEDGEIVEARIELDGVVPSGSRLAARLTATGINGRNAIATDEQGTEYLLPRGAPGVSEGASMHLEVSRSAIPGSEPWKRPLARFAADAAAEPAAPGGRDLPFPAPKDELASLGWNELVEQAHSGVVRFAGGELSIEVTRAMTVIDVDGYLPSEELAIAGAAAAARAIRRLDIGGSIGIDLPTAGGKAARQSAGEAIDRHLPQSFERTAVNGFGFVQVVRPRRRASFIELAGDRAAFEVRALLRRAAFEGPGPKRLVAHPALISLLESRPGWIATLERQLGGAIGLRADPALPMSGGYAESC